MIRRQPSRTPSTRFRPAHSLLLVAVAATLLSCEKLAEIGLGDERQYQAKARVTFILDTVRDMGNGTQTQVQTAMCRWYNNTALIQERSTLEAASDAFDTWRIEGGMIPKLETYEIGKIENEEGPTPAVWVSVNINKKGWRWLRVPEDSTITWEE
jgi:hypothetical protein